MKKLIYCKKELNLKVAEIQTLKNGKNNSNSAGSNLDYIKPGEKIIVAHFK